MQITDSGQGGEDCLKAELRTGTVNLNSEGGGYSDFKEQPTATIAGDKEPTEGGRPTEDRFIACSRCPRGAGWPWVAAQKNGRTLYLASRRLPRLETHQACRRQFIHVQIAFHRHLLVLRLHGNSPQKVAHHPGDRHPLGRLLQIRRRFS